MRMQVMLSALAVIVLSTSFSAQRRPAGSTPQDQTVAVAIDLRVNGAPYTFKGQAVCHHLAKGSIYNTLAERWSVQHSEKENSVNVTLWHPLAGGSDMVTLAVATGGKRYDVTTVKGPQGTGSAGSGSARLTREGAGGTLTIEATTAAGAEIAGTVKCERFTAPEVVAGN